MAARERRPQQKPERELPVDINIDKEKLKHAFDVSHFFDINAILRGIELTMVGGNSLHDPSECIGPVTDIVQPTELCRTLACSPPTITGRLL